MKKLIAFSLALFLVPVIAFADDGALSIGIADFIKSAFELYKNWPQYATWAAASAVLKLIVDATKTELLGGLFDKLGPIGKGLLIAFCAAASVGTTVLMAGGSLTSALVAIVGSSAGAVFLTEMWGLIKKAFGIA